MDNMKKRKKFGMNVGWMKVVGLAGLDWIGLDPWVIIIRVNGVFSLMGRREASLGGDQRKAYREAHDLAPS